MKIIDDNGAVVLEIPNSAEYEKRVEEYSDLIGGLQVPLKQANKLTDSVTNLKNQAEHDAFLAGFNVACQVLREQGTVTAQSDGMYFS